MPPFLFYLPRFSAAFPYCPSLPQTKDYRVEPLTLLEGGQDSGGGVLVQHFGDVLGFENVNEIDVMITNWGTGMLVKLFLSPN